MPEIVQILNEHYFMPKVCSILTRYELKYLLKSILEAVVNSLEFYRNGVINVVVNLYAESPAIHCGSVKYAAVLVANGQLLKILAS